MKTFFIQYQETYIETLEIQAETLEDAIDRAHGQGIDINNAEYLENSGDVRKVFDSNKNLIKE